MRNEELGMKNWVTTDYTDEHGLGINIGEENRGHEPASRIEHRGRDSAIPLTDHRILRFQEEIFKKMAETGTSSPKINMRKLVNISIKRSSLKQTSSSPPGLCEDLKVLTEIFGNKDLEPEEEVETIEELKADLKALGYDLSELDLQMKELRRKLAGKLERRLTAENTESTEGEKRHG